MITENLSTLKIHKLTQAQYNRELEAGNLEDNAIYLTPDEEIDFSPYATIEQLNSKANTSHNHSASNITSGTLSSNRLPVVPVSKGGTGASTAEEARNSLGITPVAISAVAVDNNMTGAAGDYHKFALGWSGSSLLVKIDETVKSILVDGDKVVWTPSAFALASGVTSVMEPKAKKYAQTVHLTGRVSCTSPTDLNSTVTIGTLAEGYRPTRAIYKLVPAKAGRLAKIYINTDGTVRLDAVYNFGNNSIEYDAEQSWISLDIDFII